MEKIVVISRDELVEIIQQSVTQVISNPTSVSDPAKNLEFLDIHQAAVYLNLAKQTLYGFTSNREIPFIKKGKKLYFRKQDLENWLSTGRKQTRDEIGAALTHSLAHNLTGKG